MKVELTKEQCIKMAEREGDQEIGAGGAFYARPPLRERIVRSLGFGRCSSPRFDEISDDDPNWAAATLQVSTIVNLDWLDRLRLLIGGRLLVEASVKTDVIVRHSMARSNVGVLSPFDKI